MAPLQSGNAAFLGSRLSMSANERKHDIFFSAAHRRGFFLCKEERENAAKKKKRKEKKKKLLVTRRRFAWNVGHGPLNWRSIRTNSRSEDEEKQNKNPIREKKNQKMREREREREKKKNPTTRAVDHSTVCLGGGFRLPSITFHLAPCRGQ